MVLALALSVSACYFTKDVEREVVTSAGSDGGTGGGESTTGEDFTDEFGEDFYLGTPSTEAGAVDGLFLGDKSGYAYGDEFDSILDAHAALNTGFTTPIASRDTNATSQWRLGWTGKDVKVGVVDEFNTDEIINSHGDKVSLVINSVAPEAQLTTYAFALTQDDAETAFQNLNAQDVHIINNSWGSARFDHTNGQEDTGFDQRVAQWVSARYKITGANTYSDNMLFIFSAGNSGTYCPDKRIQECSFYPAIINQLRALGEEDSEAYIWVGSLTDDGTALADYSHSAGDMGADFIVAHDDILAAGDGAGTSFAAPRVAGAAAIIRHKFPGLDGFQLKNLLLTTATDIGDPGVDEIYGHGKLNLNNALSPQGTLTAE
jgi:subtilisin family serine protease